MTSWKLGLFRRCRKRGRVQQGFYRFLLCSAVSTVRGLLGLKNSPKHGLSLNIRERLIVHYFQLTDQLQQILIELNLFSKAISWWKVSTRCQHVDGKGQTTSGQFKSRCDTILSWDLIASNCIQRRSGMHMTTFFQQSRRWCLLGHMTDHLLKWRPLHEEHMHKHSCLLSFCVMNGSIVHII